MYDHLFLPFVSHKYWEKIYISFIVTESLQ